MYTCVSAAIVRLQDYPVSATGQPVIDIQGPLAAHDPARTALQQHLAAVAAEQQQELAGSGGYIWQLVGAAKEWIDANLPDDLASRKAGQFACSAAAATAAAAVSSTTNGAAAGGAAGSSGGVPWWEKEDVDIQLVDRATAEAAAAHWASWSLGQEDNPWGADEDDPAAAAAAAAAAAGSTSSAEALSSAGDGTAGRWDYVVGLVGKPSAGVSQELPLKP
jgi:hypothetical protein